MKIFNIFKSSSNLPVNISLMAKLLAIVVLLNPYLYFVDRKLPFLEIINLLGEPTQLKIVLLVLVFGGSLLILSGYFIKWGCLLIAFSILITELSCMPCYADSRMYIFCLFFLLSLFKDSYSLWLLRCQIVLLYFGAGLNKLFDLDWQSGQYIEYWIGIYIIEYKNVSSLLPNLVLSKIISWSTILIELSLAFFFINKRFFIHGVLLALFLHGTSVFIVQHTFGSFIPGVAISFLVFIEWPKKINIEMPNNSFYNILGWFLSKTDVYNIFTLNQSDHKFNMEVYINGIMYVNWRAVQLILFYNPLFYLILVCLLLFPYISATIKGICILMLALNLIPWLNKKVFNNFQLI